MVELRVKVGKKGRIHIPKIFRDRYAVEEGGQAIMEPTVEGLLIKGRPSPPEIMDRLKKHVEAVRGMGVPSLKLGDLKKVYLEMEFEEKTG
jgi:bifunctional DNA-binding transcriptional regulator/antitoxin component of YhaV-PrlF toxin-antitoxin module